MVKLNDNIKVFKSDSVRFITKYRCYCDKCGLDRGYQTKQNAERHSICRKCKSPTLAAREKMAKAKLGKCPYNKGKKASTETRAKLSIAKLGKSAHNKGQSMSVEQRIKLSCATRKIKLSDFDNFKTEENKAERSKFANLNLHMQCFERDNFTCNTCGMRGAYLNAHHKNSWKHFPDQRLLISNLVTLCNKCHKEFHKQFGNGKKQPNTEKQFMQFKKEKGE